MSILVAITASLKEANDRSVIRILVKFQATAGCHKLFEFRRLVGTELFQGNFFLLSLDIIIFLRLRATR